MHFFVPGIAAEDAEQFYAVLAEVCHVELPPPDKRVRSISFVHDRGDWTATVGETLRGTETRRRRRQGKLVDITTHHSDSAMVWAIFTGNRCLVVTDARPLGPVVSAWDNPFEAGQAKSIEYFDSPSPDVASG